MLNSTVFRKMMQKDGYLAMVHHTTQFTSEKGSSRASITEPGKSPPHKKNWTGRLTTFARYFLTVDTHYPPSARLRGSNLGEGGEKTRKWKKMRKYAP